jgi:hypothetical protein
MRPAPGFSFFDHETLEMTRESILTLSRRNNVRDLLSHDVRLLCAFAFRSASKAEASFLPTVK